MTEFSWDILLSQVDWIAVLVVVLVTSCGIFYKFGRWQKDIDRKFEKIDDNFEEIEKVVKPLLLVHKEELVDAYFKMWGTHTGNPHFDKDDLLRKLRDGTISREESLRLQDILEEERKKANKTGGGGLWIILGLLVLLAIFLGNDEG